ncbi:hypothetical protein HY605_00555, partial [Candidatus Peregrinibacteria bacterium]|nr:hypothetical protein [Candidatus Peregrinibacteria bacterium]
MPNLANLYGIVIQSGAKGNGIYYNSIYMEAATSGIKYGIYNIDATGAPVNQIRYNIIGMKANSSTTTYNIYISAGTANTDWQSDYNDLYRYIGGGTENTGYITSARLTLNDWVTNTSRQDENSYAVNPQFVAEGSGDLHLQDSTTLSGAGLSVSGVDTDYDGQVRSNWTIGADEKLTSGPISGTKNVPGDYADLPTALNDLQRRGISGTVTLNVSINTTGIITVGSILGASSSSPVIIQSAGGVRDIDAASSSDPNIIRFTGSQYVVLKGFRVGFTTKPLYDSIVISGGATNNVIEGCAIYGTDGYACVLVTDIATQNNVIRSNNIRTPHSTAIRYGDGVRLVQSNATKVYNNMIWYAVGGSGYIGSNIHLDAGTTNNEIYYNSLYTEWNVAALWKADILFYGAVTGDAGSASTTSIGSGNYIKYNILGIAGTAAANDDVYGIFVGNWATNQNTFVSDYNDFWEAGTDPQEYIGYSNAVARDTLSDWQIGSGKDANSWSYNPYYSNIVTGDLHGGSAQVRRLGTPISYIDKDYDGDSRINPDDLGADRAGSNSGGTLAGSYDVAGGAMNFDNLEDAIMDLQRRGVSAPVTFNVYNGTSGLLYLPAITGASATNNITIQAASGQSPTISGAQTQLYFNGSQWITVKGFTINASQIGTSYTVIFNNASNNVLQNSSIYSGASALDSVYITGTSANNQILYNNIYCNSTSTYSAVSINTDSADNNVVAGNKIKCADATTAWGRGILINEADGTTIYNNMIYNTTAGPLSVIGIHLTTGVASGINDTQIYHNSFYMESTYTSVSAPDKRCVDLNTTNIGSRNYIKYNIFGMKSDAPSGQSARASGIVVPDVVPGTNWMSDRNIFWRTEGSGTGTKNTNIGYTNEAGANRWCVGYYDWRDTNATGGIIDNYSFTCDPLFVDAANGDLHIQPGSPARGMGCMGDSPVPSYITADFDASNRMTKTVNAGGNWLAGWTYRRPITMTNTSGSNLTNYQVKVTISISDGIYGKANT